MLRSPSRWMGIVSSRRLFSGVSADAVPSVVSNATTNAETTGKKTRRQEKGSRDKKKQQIKELGNDTYHIFDAVQKLKDVQWSRVNETVDVAVQLGVDPRKPDQSIKGIAKLPHGTGKVIRIGVFASGADAQKALDAGAEVVGDNDLVARVQGGEIPFDTVIATPELMPLVGKLGKILGPRGLMPNPKLGTVTKDITKAVKAARAGQVSFRITKQSIIHAGIAKLNFSNEEILDNFRSFMVAISDVKPEGLKKKYILSAYLSSTMGPGLKLDVGTIDPSSPRFMLDPSLIKK